MLLAQPLAAQATQTDTASRPPLIAPIAGGILGSGLGLVSGGALGWNLEKCGIDPEGDSCGLEGLIIGGVIGGTVGAAVGAYLFSEFTKGEPAVLASIISSVLGVGVGLLAAKAIERAGGDGYSYFAAYAIGQGAFTGLMTYRSGRGKTP